MIGALIVKRNAPKTQEVLNGLRHPGKRPKDSNQLKQKLR